MGEAECASDEDCVATSHCTLGAVYSHIQEQPAYTTEACEPNDPTISADVLALCACRDSKCMWPPQ